MLNGSLNGYFANGMLLLTGSGVWVGAQGFELSLPDLAQASPLVLNTVQDQLRLALRSLPEHQRLQFQWFCDSDYGSVLERYQRESQTTENMWVRRCRTERFERCRDEMRKGQLRHQRLVLFVSQRLPDRPPRSLRTAVVAKHYQSLLSHLAGELKLTAQTVEQALAGQGIRLAPMGDPEHYRLYAGMFNPSLVDRPDYDPLDSFDPSLSIHDNCWLSEAVGNQAGLDLDGYCHGLLVLTRWPQRTHPGIINRLTTLHSLRLQITINIEPLPVLREIECEERRYARIQGEFKSDGRPSLATVLEKKEQKIQQLMKGFLRPFRVQFLVRTWAQSVQELHTATATLKQAVNGMNGAQYFQPALPPTIRKLWYQTWPGWSWSPYRHWHLYAEDSYLSDLLPLCASSTGYVHAAEAIYNGPGGSIVGVKTTSMPGASGIPQHAVAFGASGSGKSMLTSDLLTQTAPYYDLTILIDRGLSYEALVPLLSPSARPLILRQNGNITLNYLDTQGVPLTPEHIAQAAALTSFMCGTACDENADRLRRAVLAKYIRRLYDDVFEEWTRKHPHEVDQLARTVCVLDKRRTQDSQAAVLDLFVDFREWAARHADQADSLLRQVSEDHILKTLNDPVGRQKVRDVAFARFTPAEFPTHRMLQELLQFDAAAADQQLARQMALLLEPWCAQGSHGPLFDGATNTVFDRSIIYFELGQIPESAVELQRAANFLVQNWVWQRIYVLPRSQRKRMIIDEASAFLSMPGAAEIVQRAYEQARKYNTWLLTVFQQYAPLRASPIRAAVLGNSQQFFILKQNDPEDLAQLATDLGLSKTAANEILTYPKPEQAGYSAFTYFHRDTPNPVCATAYHLPSKEMAYISNTTGAHVDKRRQELRDGLPLPLSVSPSNQPTSSL